MTFRPIKISQGKFFGFKMPTIEKRRIRITNLEKTLLDCLEKPRYCGGVLEVARALKKCQKIDTKRLLEYAERLGNETA